MSDNKIHTLGRIDQAIRGINSDGTDDGYIPPQSENGALERIEKSIKDIDIKGIKSGLPKVTNADNGKVLQVKNGKWGKGDEKLVYISGVSFLDDFHAFSENDTLYLVSGEIEEDARLNESIESEAASEDIVSYYPSVIPPEENHEPWRAFHDDDEYNGWTTKYDNEGNSAYIQYNFQNDFGVALSGIEFNTTYTYLGEEPAPEELPKIHLELELQVCDDSIHHNWTTIWTYDHEVNDDGWFGTRVIPTDHIYAVRLVCKSSIYNDNAMVTVGDFKFVGMVLNEESESREIWYKGHKFGKCDKGDIDTPVELITGDIDYNNNVTLSHSGQEIFAMMNDGKLPIIFLEHDSLYGKTYEVYNYTTWYIDSNQEKIFEFTRIRRSEGHTVFWTVPINTVSVSNVFKAKSESISSGPTRTVLFEAPDGGGVWMDSSTKYFDLNDDIDNYDEIEIICLTTEGDNNYYYAGTQKYTVTDLLEPRKDNLNMGMPFRVSAVRTTGLDTSSLSVVLIPQGTSVAIAKRTIMCLSAIGAYNWGVAIHRVIGVKY